MAISRLLLDTNMYIDYVRENETWKFVRQKYDPWLVEPRPLYCVVSLGELRSLAIQWGWGAFKREQLSFALSQCERFGIDDDAVLDAYSLIDCHCARNGLVLGKNDLWIAAVANVTGSTLLSEDRDFLPLSGQFFDFELIAVQTP